ncbi:MAG: hypothetical protein HC875_20455 [Anaerolineales bacterium]|nr:hypothetical protein [Anaerolineales bacterium]
MDEIWIALKPTISGGGRVIALSSPNGASGWFYNTYNKAEQGENDFNAIKLMWDVHPERDQAWFDKEVKTESPRFIAQEYCCFAGETLVATETGFKEIKDIQVGEKVLTHKGRFKKVEFINKRLSNDYYEVKTTSNQKITKLTGNHRILLNSGNWLEIEKITEQDAICSFPETSKNNDVVYSLTKLIHKKLIKQQIEVFNLQVEEDESYTTEHFVAHNCSFVGSGRTVIEGEKIVVLEQRAQDPIYTSGEDGNIWVFEDPEQDTDYFLTADVARGDGEDYSTFHIFKKNNLEQVVEYRGKVKADEFSTIIYNVCKIYNDCLAIVENNVIGLEVANLLIKMDYENIYYQDKRTREFLTPSMARDNEHALAGFAVQDKNTRDKLIVSF